MTDPYDGLFDILIEAIQEQINSDILHQLKTGEDRSYRPLPYTGPDIFWLQDQTDGDQKYAVRGFGPTYSAFYEFMRGEVSPYLVSEYDDWPWHYFTLKPDTPPELLKPWLARSV